MPVALLSDIVIISITMIITLMIYRDMKFLLSPIPTHQDGKQVIIIDGLTVKVQPQAIMVCTTNNVLFMHVESFEISF